MKLEDLIIRILVWIIAIGFIVLTIAEMFRGNSFAATSYFLMSMLGAKLVSIVEKTKN